MTASCIWCPKPGTTKDHLIPHWYTRQVNIIGRTYPSCQKCNTRKGPMPPLVFQRFWRIVQGNRIFHRTLEYRQEYREWSQIATYFRKTSIVEIPESLLEFVAGQMMVNISLYGIGVVDPVYRRDDYVLANRFRLIS